MKRRNTTTKKDIRETFIELLNTKGFDNLTVSDIARGAKINRGTFYLHYGDKYDLLEKLEMEIIYDLKRILLFKEESESATSDEPIDIIPHDRIVAALYYMKDDFDFFHALAGKGGDQNFPALIKEVLGEMVLSGIEQFDHASFSKDVISEEYALDILLAGIVAVIMLWINKGGVESPEEIAEILTVAKTTSPYDMLVG